MADGVAVIVGVGPGLGAALARAFAGEGLDVALAGRTPEKIEAVAVTVPGARAYQCNATDEAAVAGLFDRVEAEMGPVTVAVYNGSAGFSRAPIAEMTVERMRQGWEGSALGGFCVGREAARRMLPRGDGTILFTGATASLRGGKGFAAFAGGKFALRALAQSMARELGPQGIHVGHVVVDAVIGSEEGDTRADPEAIAAVYLHLYRQHRSAWSFEADVRPWTENF